MTEPRHDSPDRDDASGHGLQLSAAASGQDAVQDRPAVPGKAILITFPPSLDCELSRFLLAHYRIPYEERRHTVIFSFFATLWHGSTIYFPLLYGGSWQPLDTVRKMIDYFDPLCPMDRNLLLTGRERESVEADWTAFNATLGGATAAFSYFHLLPHRQIMIRPLTEGTPAYEVFAVRWAYPLFAAFLRKVLHLSAGAAQEFSGKFEPWSKAWMRAWRTAAGTSRATVSRCRTWLLQTPWRLWCFPMDMAALCHPSPRCPPPCSP